MSSTTNYYQTAEDFDWFKHYPAASAMTTAHLSHVERGVYQRLLDHYWTADNRLPQDAGQIAERIGEKVFNWRRYGITAPAGFDNEEVTIKVIEHVLDEFFEQDEDGNWRHVWLDDYRRAADKQFQERSKASKERAARQARGERGKFSKGTAEPTPCPTADATVPHGENTVDQSREEKIRGEQTKEEEIRKDESKEACATLAQPPEEPSVHDLLTQDDLQDGDQRKDGVTAPLPSAAPPSPKSEVEFPVIPPREGRYKVFKELSTANPEKAQRFVQACKQWDAANAKAA